MPDDSFTAADPIKKFLMWYSEAQTGRRGKGLKNYLVSSGFGLLRRVLSSIFPESNLFRPDVSTLATISHDNKPSARSILFHGLAEGGFSFYTDYESEKGIELELNPSAVIVFYWRLPPRQVRIDGKVQRLSREAAKFYWESRTRANQVAAAAVRQSSTISGREELIKKTRYIEQLYRGKPIPCPDSWGGYSLVPEKIEFWEGRRDWLHDRERYILNDGRWTNVKLAP
ncbi:MAG: pyridoxamine 5'-phosphate oxidase [Chloroflexi bacterium]|nr:pyridoxamine 5'-phosphate oxidase [Chloroflexota bacterium]